MEEPVVAEAAVVEVEVGFLNLKNILHHFISKVGQATMVAVGNYFSVLNV